MINIHTFAYNNFEKKGVMSPFKPARPCPGRGRRYHSCPNSVRGSERYCPDCQTIVDKESAKYDKERDQTEERQFIHSPAWRALTELKASINPLCEECLKQDRDTPRDLSHHIKPVKTHPELRLALENLMSVCNNCHEQVFHRGERWGR